VRNLNRRELLTDLALLCVCGVAYPLSESNRTGGYACDFCCAPAADALDLAFCIRCDAVIHRDCAALGPCDPDADSDWRQMCHEAAPDAIEHLMGHELILPIIQFSDPFDPHTPYMG